MPFRGTPGPGGFGPSLPFGPPRAGVKLVPAQTRPRPGVYSGRSAVMGVHPWVWLVVLILLGVVVAVVVSRVRGGAGRDA